MTAAPIQNSVQLSPAEVSQLSVDLKNAVKQVKEIQVLVTNFIDTIAMRKNDEAEKEIQSIKETMKKLHTVKSELEKIAKISKDSNMRLNNIHPVPLGNNGYISLDPTEDRNNFYQQLLETYAWLNNIDHDATELYKTLKRKHHSRNEDVIDAKYQRPVESLQDIVSNIQGNKLCFPSITLNDRYLLTQSYLEIQVGSTFVCHLFFSGTAPCFVKTKDLDEMFHLDPVDSSKKFVFQKLSDVLLTCILNLMKKEPGTMLKEFLSYLSGFKDMFSTKCKLCNKHLILDTEINELLPPTWIEMDGQNKSLYHFDCKPKHVG